MYGHERLDHSLLQAKVPPLHVPAVRMYNRLTPFFPDFMYTPLLSARHVIILTLTNSMDTSLSTFQEIEKDREARRAAVHGVAKSWTQLSDWTTDDSRVFQLQRKVFTNVFFKNSYFDTISDLQRDYKKSSKDFPNVDIFPPFVLSSLQSLNAMVQNFAECKSSKMARADLRNIKIILQIRNPSDLLFWLGCEARGTLVPWPGAEPVLSAAEVWSRNHWKLQWSPYPVSLIYI